MTQRAAAKISAFGSIFAGLTILFFYFREKLPLTDVYVAKKEMPYYLISLAAAIVGVFLLAAGWKKKKTALMIVAGLLFVGIPLLFYAVGRAPFDYAPIRLRIVGRGLIPAVFLFLGIFAFKGWKWVHGVSLTVFSLLGLYHLYLAVKMISSSGDAFSSVKTGDIFIAASIAVISLFFVWVGYQALGRKL